MLMCFSISGDLYSDLLNVITDPKLSEVLNVITFDHKCNKLFRLTAFVPVTTLSMTQVTRH